MPKGLRAASKIILPGVGHFGQMMRALDALGVRQTLLERIAAGVPFLGICLGLQALFETSEEAPEARGLGLYEGTVRRFPLDARVPHMGWNELEVRRDSRLAARPALRARTSTSPTATTCPRIPAPPRPAPTSFRTPRCSRPATFRRAVPSREIRPGGLADREEFRGGLWPVD